MFFDVKIIINIGQYYFYINYKNKYVYININFSPINIKCLNYFKEIYLFL